MPSTLQATMDGAVNTRSSSESLSTNSDHDLERKNNAGKDEEVKLQRMLSLFDGIMINVGVMIGSGIFISPKGVLAGVHSIGATLLIWVTSGIISFIGAMCYAELGTTIKSSGGTYTYILVTIGDFVGFIVFFGFNIFIVPCANAITALAFSHYCLQPFFPDSTCPVPEIATKLVAALCVMFLSFVNGWSVRFSSLLQDGTSIFKLVALAIIIITGIVMLGQGKTEHFGNAFESTNLKGIGSALFASLYSYDGWDCLNIVVEELKNPQRNLLIAIFMSISIVTFVYTLTNVAYFTILSPAEMLNSDSVAFTFAAEVMGRFAFVIPVVVALSCLGSLNGSILSTSRQALVGARHGHFPNLVAMIGLRQKTPIPSIIFKALLTLCFLSVDNIFTLINYFSVVQWLWYVLVSIGLLRLRAKEPNRPRPFKVNILVIVLFLITSLFLLVSGAMAAPVDAAIGCAILLSSIPFYIICVNLSTRPKWMIKIKRAFVITSQKLLYVVMEDPSNDDSP